MIFSFKPVAYDGLNARQKENFNFHKVAARLADYGFTSIRLSDDWNGADFLALHRDGETLKIQLKPRLTFEKKYVGKGLWVCFPRGDEWYVYPHDELLALMLPVTVSGIAKSGSWKKGGFNFPKISRKNVVLLEPFRLPRS